jgi:LPXTG-motif cell wall-anchored protein
MNVALFTLANFLGTIIWCAALAWAGHVLGANFDKVHQYVGPVTWVVLAGLLIGGVVWGVRRRKKRKR